MFARFSNRTLCYLAASVTIAVMVGVEIFVLLIVNHQF